MITVMGLEKAYKSFHILKGIDLHVREGEIYGFIGKNGAGKTTTMNILAGLSRPTQGECFVNGQDVTKIKHPGELKIGYLPEEPSFYPWMTAYEMLDYLSGGAGRARITDMLGWVGLSDAANRRVGGFSRGMKQRLGMSAALIRNPALMILDEPCSALDPEGRNDVLRLISEVKQMGKTVLFSTHILSDVERVCDSVGMIIEGKMAFQKPLEQLLRENAQPIFDITLLLPYRADIVSKLNLLEGITEIKWHGGSLSVRTEDTAEASKRLMHFFADNNIAVRTLSLRKNNLEDLFIQEACDDSGN